MKMVVEPAAFFNWSPGSYDWDVRLNPDVPVGAEVRDGREQKRP